jgi:ribosome recycling factor
MTAEEVNEVIEFAKDSMEESIEHLRRELGKVSAGKASPAMFAGIMVMYYGSPTPISQVASVTTADARTIIIQPWEKNMLSHIEKGIFEANMGVTPQNDGILIRISIPPLTEERRRDLAKRCKSLTEDSKVGIRSARREAVNDIRKAVKDGFSEDAGKGKEAIIQEMTDKHVEKAERMMDIKEREIMTV